MQALILVASVACILPGLLLSCVVLAVYVVTAQGWALLLAFAGEAMARPALLMGGSVGAGLGLVALLVWWPRLLHRLVFTAGTVSTAINFAATPSMGADGTHWTVIGLGLFGTLIAALALRRSSKRMECAAAARPGFAAHPRASALLLAAGLALAAPGGGARAEPAPAPMQECDRLAAVPSDRDKPAGVPGVPFRAMDAAAASRACEAAIQADPGAPRFRLQLGRVRQKQERMAEAARLYDDAARQGYAAAQQMLGQFYDDGLGGLDKDQVRAAQLFRLAAVQGNMLGQAYLADFYRLGLGGLDKDLREAARLYSLAAKAGDAASQARIGWFHRFGSNGLPQDDRAAELNFRLAAGKGNAMGQIGLASLYLSGLGGLPVDYGKAQILLHQAADQGDAEAQYLIGFCHEKGMQPGSKADMQEAVRYYRLAARIGSEPAQARLRQLGLAW